MTYILSCSLTIGLFFVSVMAQSSVDLRDIDPIRNEQECSAQGGTCVIAADCPEGSISTVLGLCPQQRSRGVECCYGISVKETMCNRRGGVCFDAGICPSALVDSVSTDCETGTECCILV